MGRQPLSQADKRSRNWCIAHCRRRSRQAGRHDARRNSGNPGVVLHGHHRSFVFRLVNEERKEKGTPWNDPPGAPDHRFLLGNTDYLLAIEKCYKLEGEAVWSPFQLFLFLTSVVGRLIKHARLIDLDHDYRATLTAVNWERQRCWRSGVAFTTASFHPAIRLYCYVPLLRRITAHSGQKLPSGSLRPP